MRHLAEEKQTNFTYCTGPLVCTAPCSGGIGWEQWMGEQCGIYWVIHKLFYFICIGGQL